MDDCLFIAKQFLEALDKGEQPEVALANILKLNLADVRKIFVSKTIYVLSDEHYCFKERKLVTFFIDLALNIYPLAPRVFSGVLWEVLRLIEKFGFIQEKIKSATRKYLFKIKTLSMISGLVMGLMPIIFWYISTILNYGLGSANLAFLFSIFFTAELFAFFKLDLIARSYFDTEIMRSIKRGAIPIYLISALAGLMVSFVLLLI